MCVFMNSKATDSQFVPGRSRFGKNDVKLRGCKIMGESVKL